MTTNMHRLSKKRNNLISAHAIAVLPAPVGKLIRMDLNRASIAVIVVVVVVVVVFGDVLFV